MWWLRNSTEQDTYDLTRTHHLCRRLDRPGTSCLGPGLELSDPARPYWQCDLLHAISGAMDGLRAQRTKRHPGFVLVLEHLRQHRDVLLFHLQARPGRHSG